MSNQGAKSGAAPAGTARPDNARTARFGDEIMGFIPPAQYARYGYILALSGAVGGLLLSPLAIVALAGFGLALLGLTVHRPRMNPLDVHHLGLICLVVVVAGLLLFVSRGTVAFLLLALVQIAALYVAFNSYRHGRLVTPRTAKEELLRALKPGAPPLADHEPTRVSNPTE